MPKIFNIFLRNLELMTAKERIQFDNEGVGNVKSDDVHAMLLGLANYHLLDAIIPTDMSVSSSQVNLEEGGGTKDITVTVQPPDSTFDIQVSNTSTSVATISKTSTNANVVTYRITPVGEGECTFNFTIASAPGVTASCKAIVTKPNPNKLTVSKSSLDFVLGDAAQTFTATLEPVNSKTGITITGSNDAIATVSKTSENKNVTTYTVTPKSEGTFTVTLASTVAPTVKSTCNITVSKPDPNKVTITPSTVALEVGGEAKEIVATLEPANSKLGLKVTGNNEAVATVTKKSENANATTYTITPVGAGEFDITIASSIVPTVKSTCKITVTAPEEPVKEVDKKTVSKAKK